MDIIRLMKAVAVASAVGCCGVGVIAAGPANAAGSCPTGYTPVNLQNGQCFCSPDSSNLPEIGNCGTGQSTGPSGSQSSSGSQYRNDLVGQGLVSNSQQSAIMIKEYLQTLIDQVQGRNPGAFSQRIPARTGFADETPQTWSTNPLASMPLGFASDPSNPMYTKAPLYKAPPPPPGPTFGIWGQGYGGFETRDMLVGGVDLSHNMNTYGFQGGIDEMWRSVSSPNDAFVFGGVASYTTALMSFADATNITFWGPGVGLYSTYVNGGFSTDVTGKIDFLSLGDTVIGAATASTNVDNYTVAANAQYKFDMGGPQKLFIEPTVGAIYTNTQFDSSGAVLGFADGYCFRLQGGLRFGSEFEWSGSTIDASVKGLVYSDAIDRGTVLAVAGGPTSSLDEGQVRGEFDFELNATLANGYSAFGTANVYFGDSLVGGMLMGGVRKQW